LPLIVDGFLSSK